MSFAADVKAELSSVTNENDCCKRAEAYGLLLFSRFFDSERIMLQTENEFAARKYMFMLKSVCGCTARLKTPAKKNGLFTVEVSQRDISGVLGFFGHTGSETVLRINRANVEFECCQYAFIRGAFLSCGTASDPAGDYHAEFLVGRKQLSLDFINLLEEAELFPRLTERKGAQVIYFKESSAIEDLLTMMRATNCSLELMNKKIEKDIRNRVNRRTNCETANIDRTMRAVERQREAIELISRHGGIEMLPAQLFEAAALRRDNPYASLSELAALSDSGLSRSGINHRLCKIIEYADELKNAAENEK